MSRTRTEGTERHAPSATAAGRGLGNLPVGSAVSRAAARSLVIARQSEAEEDWDTLDPPTGIAEILEEGWSRRHEQREPRKAEDWGPPIEIPPGKEDTVRGRYYARWNAARARMLRLESEREMAGR
jgi:hypothetical protein